MARILVIDDDALVRETIKAMLVAGGHDVSTAVDGDDGCAQFSRSRFDLVICDMFMPGKDGIETVKELRESAPAVPIIGTTGGGSYRAVSNLDPDGLLRMSRTLGATQTIPKPFKIGDLLAAVQACLSIANAP
jgi:DNA-binding response OmpR family regulator